MASRFRGRLRIMISRAAIFLIGSFGSRIAAAERPRAAP